TRFSTEGNPAWTHGYPHVGAFTFDPSGNVLVAGDADSDDIPGQAQRVSGPYVLKLDSNGAPLWSRLLSNGGVRSLGTSAIGTVVAASDGSLVVLEADGS